MTDVRKEAADQFAGETYMVYNSFIDAGFTKNEAFELIKGYINSCGFVCMKQVFNRLQQEQRRQSRSELFRKEDAENAD